MKHICNVDDCRGYGYLKPEIVAVLTGDYRPVDLLVVEFLGHLSFSAAAINNSRNPKKAACTLMEKDNLKVLFAKFLHRKSTEEEETPEMNDAITHMVERFHRRNPRYGLPPEPEFDYAAFHNAPEIDE